MNVALHPKTISGIALAAGAGGLELGVSLAIPRYRTVCFVERDAYAAASLVARMEDATLDEAPIWSDLVTFNGEQWRGKVDFLTAGYPCQPFSNAGKRLGEKDPRHLWPHVRRILKETEAPFLFAENVLGHVSLGLENVREDLLSMGYKVEAGIFAAAEVGAPHIRKRLFILAYADDTKLRNMAGYVAESREILPDTGKVSARNSACGDSLDSALYGVNGETASIFPPDAGQFDAWESWLRVRPELQPAIPRSSPGLAYKLDRYRLTGNGVCPLAAGYALGTLLDAAQRSLNAA